LTPKDTFNETVFILSEEGNFYGAPNGSGTPHCRGFTIILRNATHSAGLLRTGNQPDALTSTWL